MTTSCGQCNHVMIKETMAFCAESCTSSREGDICCLCRHHVNEASARVKRKRFHGKSCESAKKLIDDLLMESQQLSTLSFKEMKDSSVYLCHLCHAQATRYLKHQDEMRKIKGSILSMAANLTKLPAVTLSRKRSASVTDSADKRRATVVQSGSFRESETVPASNVSMSRPSELVDSPPSMSTSQTEPNTNTAATSPAVTLTVDRKSGKRDQRVDTPTRRHVLKQVYRREYSSAHKLIQNEMTPDELAANFASLLMNEIKGMCRLENSSVFRDSCSLLHNFSWEAIWAELEVKAPTLLRFYKHMLRGAQKPLICFAISLIVKWRSPGMGLVQRVISCLMYGNGASKQMYNCFQPLMVCLSYTGTLAQMKRLAKDYDAKVLGWADKLLGNVPADVKRRKVTIVWDEADDNADCSDGESSEEDSGEDNDDHDENENETRIEVETLDQVDNDEEDGRDCDFSVEIDDAQAITDSIEAIDNSYSHPTCYKIIGDNIDKNIRPSFQRIDHQTKSLHYFHILAAKDRIDFSSLPDLTPHNITIDPMFLLPGSTELSTLLKELQVIVSRVLVLHMDTFSSDKKSVQWHIPNQYSREMAQKSEVVPLGVQLYNENKVDQMCSIMKNVHKYVPKATHQVVHQIPGENISGSEEFYHDILFGGDQLTVCRSRGAQSARCNDDSPVERLEGLIPVVEDWHARLTLMRVIWKRLFSNNSSAEKGTLQLQVNYTLSPRQAAQLKWSRCVNTTNLPGHNIPMDLRLEHLNRRLKGTMRNMGSNMTESSVKLAAECIQIVDGICSKFEECTSKCALDTDKHSSPSFEGDFKLILQCLMDQQVYVPTDTQHHASFKFSSNLLQQYKYKELILWMKHKVPTLV